MPTVRNPVYNADGSVNCEVLNENEQWMPYTASDAEESIVGMLIWELVNTMAIAPYVPPDPDPVESSAVDREAARRVLEGRDFTVSGGTYTLGFSASDRLHVTEVCVLANSRVAASDTTPITFLDKSGNVISLTPTHVVDLCSQIVEWVNSIRQFAVSLKAQDPIPQNYTDNTHWE